VAAGTGAVGGTDVGVLVGSDVAVAVDTGVGVRVGRAEVSGPPAFSNSFR